MTFATKLHLFGYQAAKGKDKALMPWVKDIVNHFWFCCQEAKTEEHFKVGYMCKKSLGVDWQL